MVPEISIVVPVYGCAECLEPLCSRLHSCLEPSGRSYEIVLVDDRSPDRSWRKILEIAGLHPNVRGVRLSRNFGQHIAITAGLSESVGELVVVMDCDLQDPPEKIPDLIALADNGFDVVLAKRIQRAHAPWRILGAKVFARTLAALSGVRMDATYGSLSLLRRKVVDAYLRLNEPNRHYLFIVRWLGFETGEIQYEHQDRLHGSSSYTLRSLFQHAVNGLMFQTTAVLRLIIWLGLVSGGLGVVLGAHFLIQYFFNGSTVLGWTSLIVALLLSTGAILFSLGVTAMYVGKIFEQTKSRPLFVVDSRTS